MCAVLRTMRADSSAIVILLALGACATPPPPGVNPIVYRQALDACRAEARAYFEQQAREYGAGLSSSRFWEVVDPCMRAKGLPPPPY